MLGYRSKHNLNIGKTKICIQNNDAMSQFTELNGDIDRNIAFADAALSTGDCNNSGLGPLW